MWDATGEVMTGLEKLQLEMAGLEKLQLEPLHFALRHFVMP